jgi:hypothetical protein
VPRRAIVHCLTVVCECRVSGPVLLTPPAILSRGFQVRATRRDVVVCHVSCPAAYSVQDSRPVYPRRHADAGAAMRAATEPDMPPLFLNPDSRESSY